MTQAEALNILKAGKNVYLTGPAGTGKTYVLNEFVRFLTDRDVSVAVTASTGIAATHLNGLTIHSWSGIGVRDFLTDTDIELLVQREYLFRRFEKTAVLVIDEVSMITPEFFDSIDRLARAMRGSSAPFGGMQVVLSGDFFQLPPVRRSSDDISFVVQSRAWRELDIRVCYLSEQFRQTGDALSRILTEMRAGEVSEDSRDLLRSCAEVVVHDIEPTRLYTHNVDVDELNRKELMCIDAPLKTYTANTKGKASAVAQLQKGILAPQELELKVGASVMFVRNGFNEGYVNGTLGVVEELNETHPVVRTRDGVRIEAHPVEWSIEEDGKSLAVVAQVPLRLAWAITIHKSQGMTLDAARIDLSRAFVSGQGYVALSRLRTIEGLVLEGLNERALSVHPQVQTLDAYLQSESNRWSAVIARFSQKDFDAMHNQYVLSRGGTIDESAIAANQAKEALFVGEKKSAHHHTRDSISKGDTIEDLAKKRGVTVGTILTHLEKLHEEGHDVTQFAPPEEELLVIRMAFDKVPTKKLTAVRRILGDTYSFDDLKRARIFL